MIARCRSHAYTFRQDVAFVEDKVVLSGMFLEACWKRVAL